MQLSCTKPMSALILLTLLSACGGGSSSNGTGTLSGVFIDSPVEGLRWESGGTSGNTDNTGKFSYASGANVQWYVGDILLGEAVGDSIITPLDLVVGAQDITNPTVTNIVRFLLTLDDDNDPSNGIKLTDAVTDLTVGESVDFAVSTAEFSDSGEVQVLISALTAATEAGPRLLVGVTEAQNHIGNSISDLIAGTYNGTFSGDFQGTWSGTVSNSGVFTGTGSASDGDNFSFSGTVSTNGSGVTEFQTSGGTSDGTSFSGTFSTNGNAAGTWGSPGAEGGTWTGSKN